jgi:preprotein translocase subunit SecD
VDKQQSSVTVSDATFSPQKSLQQQPVFSKTFLFLRRYTNMGKKWRASIFTVVLLLIGLLSLVYSTRALADLIFYPVAIEGFQTQVVLHPKPAAGVISAADLSEARAVVARRLDQLQMPGSYRLIAENGQLSLTLPATEQTPYVIDLVSHVGQIEFIDGGTNSPPLGRWVQTHAQPAVPDAYRVLFTAQDIEAVTPPDTEAGHIFYRLSLTASGQQRVADFVAGGQGNYVCMVIDQQVINCSSMYHLSENTLDILPSLGSGNMISLNDLAVFVESGPLPVPLAVER